MNVGEREMPAIAGTIEGIDAQHVQRYEFARNFTRNRRVLDAASGCGYASLILEARHYVGMDYDADVVAFANEHYGNEHAEFLVQDLCDDIPLTDSFGVCVSFETIEHLSVPAPFLAWASIHCDTFIGSSPIKLSCPQSTFHVREYTVEEFREVMGNYWNHVDLFVQDGMSLRHPCLPEDRGNVIGVCW
jgi:hypothetical protein